MDEKLIRVGSKFQITLKGYIDDESDEYILALIGPEMLCLINIVDGFRWSDAASYELNEPFTFSFTDLRNLFLPNENFDLVNDTTVYLLDGVNKTLLYRGPNV
jgi:hypothetical protein